MSKYVLVRGWLECDFNQVKQIERINEEFIKCSKQYSLSETIVQMYSKGWFYPKSPINWTSVVCLGVNINHAALYYIKEMVVNVSEIEMLDGYFRVSDDEGDLFLEWIVKDGFLEERAVCNS